MQVQVTDVSSGGFGLGWSHTRMFTNRMRQPFNRGNGWNWNVENWPYLVNSPFAGSTLALLGNVYDVDWFLDNGDGSYTTLFGRLKTLEHDTESSVFRLIEADGTVYTFNDMSHPTRPGLFKSVTTPGGNTTEVVQQSESEILEVQRSYVSGTDTITESYFYEFFPSEATNAHHLERVTLRRRVNEGAWQDVLKAEYAYYGTDESFGSLNDLKTVTRHEWNGSSWTQLDVSHYRYWKADETNGMEHGLKYVVGPEAYAKMVAAGLDPLAAGDGTIALYADYYFEYDANRFVTKEIVDGGARTFTFEYTMNPNYTGGQPRDFNFWMRRTIETLPDGTQNIVYCNETGQTMLKLVKSGTNEWFEFVRYDDIGRAILEASSSAVSGYDEANNDLLGYDPATGSYQYLKDNEGLIRLREFYTTTGAGAAAGHLKCEKIKRGQNGTEIKLRQWEYASHTAGGVTVHPVSKEIVYPDEANQAVTIETMYAYTFHADTTQIEQKTTTLPVIPASQNGSGTANSFQEVFDQFGNKIWHKDERGFITRMKYDIETGAMTQRIDDVDTTQTADEPAGWTTPAGGGLHLVTDYEHDGQGRITQELGPAHEIDLGGVATTVRTAQWTVYKDAENRTLAGSGFQKVSDSSFTLVNPVSITVTDKNGNLTDEIQAVRASTAGKLQPSDSFGQSSYVRWTTHQYTECCKLVSTRVYHTIPGSGEGARGTNYDQTDFGYDLRDRRNRVVSPGGTITRTVFDTRSLPVKTYIGTDDTGASDTDPTGGAAPGNNMVLVTENEYDGSTAGGDGNLTRATQHVDASTARMTTFGYDWRNRQTDIDGEIDFYQKTYHDSLDRATKVERYDTTAAGNLIGLQETRYDDLGRVYRTVRYAVDPATGTVGNALTDNTWYDPAGNVIKQQPAGSKLFTKSVYDGMGRQTKQYVGFDIDETTYAEADDVVGDTILEQAETQYDAAGNAVQITTRQRYHNATGTGELNGPAGPEPKARVSYAAAWYDGIGREIATADYGTNGGTALSRPSTIPTRSDTVLVTATAYNDRGEAFKSVDPAGKEDRQTFDDAGRQTRFIENYVDGDPATGGADEDLTTEWTYTPDGNVATLTAKNRNTGDQVTRYVYGTTLSDSDVARSDLLRAEIYPDSDDTSDPLGDGPDAVYDRLEHRYNRLGERKETKDQNKTIHAFDRDRLGRLVEDRVTALGTGIDAAVRRISTTYEVRGLPLRITSHDDSTVGLGTVVNQVEFAYTNFSQLVTEYQSHSGAVDPMKTPKVQYAYADGSANHVRRTSLTYPNGRVVSYDYGPSGGIDDAASRVQAIVEGGLVLAQYDYLGQGTPVVVDYTEPDVKYTLVDLSLSNDPDTGDIYSGLDRFGRVKDSRWHDYAGSTDVDRIKYGYDRAGNRLWRENVMAAANGADVDEFYRYDGLHRLKDFDRGRLNATRDGLSTTTFAQEWSLDPTGNWSNFREDQDGDATWDLDQNRASNRVNEITDVTETTGPAWATPAYDRAGNMVTMPRPDEPELSFTATYDAWNRSVAFAKEGFSTFQENRYDGRGYRLVRKLFSSGTLIETHHYFYTAAWQVLEARLDSATAAERQFVWGLRYIDDLVLRDRDTTGNGALDERLYALQDGNWNVTAIADENGDVQERYAYSAYGEPVFLSPTFASRSSSDYGWNTLYAGYHYDTAVGLFPVRNRPYHPLLGDWLTRDLFHEGSVNLYNYVENDPLAGVDPSGLIKETTAKQILIGCFFRQFSGSIGSIARESLVDTSDASCTDEILSQIGSGAILGEATKVFEDALIFGPLKAFPGEKGFKVTVEVLKELRKLQRDKKPRDQIVDQLIKRLLKRTKVPKRLRPFLKKLIKDIPSLAIGDCRQVKLSYEASTRLKNTQKASCEFLVCAETSSGLFGFFEKPKKWTVAGSCDYRCDAKPGCKCCCGQRVNIFVAGEGEGSGTSCETKKATIISTRLQ